LRSIFTQVVERFMPASLAAMIFAVNMSAQNFPPPNPYMGPDGTSTMHANAASSDATFYPGPGSGPVSYNPQTYGAAFASILMASDGMLMCVATKIVNRTPYVYLIDPVTLSNKAEMELVKSTTSDLAGGIYSYLDNNSNLVLVNANGDLQRISHSQESNGTWQLTVQESVPIGYPDVVGLVPDYSGNVWFATAQGTNAGAGAVVGYYSPFSKQTFSFQLPAGEQVANSISSSPNGVAVASTAALYMFNANADNGSVTNNWRTTYDRGPARKPGQLSWGTGSTPSFFGPTTGFEYLTITDNAAPQENILVLNATNGALIGSAPFLTSGVNSGTENAAIAISNSIYLSSTYGYGYPPGAASGPSDPSSAPFVGGMQRVDVLPDGSGLTNVWMNQTLPSAAVPRLSTSDNLIYTVTYSTNTGIYSFVTVDPTDGSVLSSTNVGTANTLQMVGVIGPNGVLYQGTETGLFSVAALPEPSTYALLGLGALALLLARRRAGNP
jgi:hypothetical protein